MNNNNYYKHTPHLEISANFYNFKVGLMNRLTNNYNESEEQKFAIESIGPITYNLARQTNAFCTKILPILWNANPPQNEKDYSSEIQRVIINICCSCNHNKQLKVKSYFYSRPYGNPIKGSMHQSEINRIQTDGLNNIIKETAIRETFEEVGIKLKFVNDTICSLSLYDQEFNGSYNIINSDTKHSVNINLSCQIYDLIKNIVSINIDQMKSYIENTGEISGILL